MQIFVYEFVTGGGWYSHDPAPPPESLVAEGSAMLSALASDFSSLGATVDVLQDARFRSFPLNGCRVHEVGSAPDEKRSFARCAASADWSVVIAPEFCGHLHARASAVEGAGGRLLGLSPKSISLAADKHATAEHLLRHGVRVPSGVALAAGERLPEAFDYPAVLKRRDGAGSLDTRLVVESDREETSVHVASRLEAYCPGVPASVAFLCGPKQIVPLAPCRQSIGDDGHFPYQGGSLPLEFSLAVRARRLATWAIETLENPLGYCGVDLILGPDPLGCGDAVIEINPRLTTSYVGLRELADGNLAQAMLDVAEGREVQLCWKSGLIEFDPAGGVRWIGR